MLKLVACWLSFVIPAISQDASAVKNMTIQVIDELQNEVIEGARIDFSNCGGQRYVTDENGRFTWQIGRDFDCHIEISKEGYTTYQKSMSYGDMVDHKLIKVRLSTLKGCFVGYIKNQSNQVDLSDVDIYIFDDRGQIVKHITSNDQGKYSFYFEENKAYRLFFHKPGYELCNQVLNIAADWANRSNDLGITFLQPLAIHQKKNITRFGKAFQAKRKVEKPFESYRYFVKLAVLQDEQSVDLQKYAQQGELYASNQGGWRNIYLGTYTAENHAAQKLSELYLKHGMKHGSIEWLDPSQLQRIDP